MKHFIKVFTKNKDVVEFTKSILGNNFLYMEDNKSFVTFILHQSVAERTMERYVKTIYNQFSDDEIYFENSTDVKSFTDDQIQNMLYELAKYMHNKSMQDKIAAGWRYGDRFDSSEKTSPLIKPYDDLPEEHRQLRPDIFTKVLEIIGKNSS
jgi:hypothetical protein